MPYSDQWGITITRTGNGVYAISRFGVSATVTIDQIFANESINVAAALARACDVMAQERLRFGDGDLSRLWSARGEYAVVRWKLLAYQAVIDTSSGTTRTQLRAKRQAWLDREPVKRALLGTEG